MNPEYTTAALAAPDGTWWWAFVAMALLWAFLIAGVLTLYAWLIRRDPDHDFDRGL